MINLSQPVVLSSLQGKINELWELSAQKLKSIASSVDPNAGASVFTVDGTYTTRGWTEWTQGFQFGSLLLQYDATKEADFLNMGRERTLECMASHVTHFGVHDHGFNNVSTYGTLWRLMNEGVLPEDKWERAFYELALKCSGAVQANRWTYLNDGGGFIHSFNGPHSLFSDTIRSLRVLAIAHQLGHVLMGENDQPISLLERLVDHAETTAKYNVYYGTGRDGYDVRGRVVHESIFNVHDGNYRCPSTQQGYTPFSTWTRGLAWILCGYAELLEFLDMTTDAELDHLGGREAIETMMLNAALATGDFYIDQTPTCGIPYWDTGAPGLKYLGDYLNSPADPFNAYEPVDSSAAAIGAQGLLRLGRFLNKRRESEAGDRFVQAGLRICDTLLNEPYLSRSVNHQGLLLHVVYHWPNRWDHVPAGGTVANGESAMWGDYHLRELALYVQRLIHNESYLAFFKQES